MKKIKKNLSVVRLGTVDLRKSGVIPELLFLVWNVLKKRLMNAF